MNHENVIHALERNDFPDFDRSYLFIHPITQNTYVEHTYVFLCLFLEKTCKTVKVVQEKACPLMPFLTGRAVK